jgi:hypothetical protein
MKQYMLTFALILVSVILTGQDSLITDTLPTGKTFHVYKDAAIAFAPTFRYSTPEGGSMAGTLKMRMFLGKRISFDSEITFGKDYVTFGPGLLGIPCWLLLFPSLDEEMSFNEMIGVAILAALTAEHTAYHIPLKKYTDLSPYISLLKFKTYYGSYKDAHPYTSVEDQVCFAIGIELNKYFNKIVLSPYIEYNQGYGDSHGFMYAGVYLGFYIFN